MLSTKNLPSTIKVRIFLRSKGNLVGPHNFKGMFEGGAVVFNSCNFLSSKKKKKKPQRAWSPQLNAAVCMVSKRQMVFSTSKAVFSDVWAIHMFNHFFCSMYFCFNDAPPLTSATHPKRHASHFENRCCRTVLEWLLFQVSVL